MFPLDVVTRLIARHEGFRATAYHDACGKLRIGYGTNLDGAGAAALCQMAGVNFVALRDGDPITQGQALVLLQKAARHAMDCATIVITGYNDMPDKVQLAIADMIYSMGLPGFMELHGFIASLEAHNWECAATKMKNSAWFHQAGQRAIDDLGLIEGVTPVPA